MAAATSAKGWIPSFRRKKKGDRSFRKQLRAAKRATVGTIYVPPGQEGAAAAVAQLAASSGVTIPTLDGLNTIQVKKKVASAQPVKEEAKKKPEPQVKTDTNVKVKSETSAKEEPEQKPEPTKGLSKKQRKLLRKAEKQQTNKPVSKKAASKPKPEVKGKVEAPELTEDGLLRQAVESRFDLLQYLKFLLDEEPKQATAYLNTVTSYSEQLGQALISLHADEIRDALHAGRTPDETMHFHEGVVPRVKQKYEDENSRQSTHSLEWHEGGMHLYKFSYKVYVVVTDGDTGEVLEKGLKTRWVKEYRTKAYAEWLERNYEPKKKVVNLNSYDRSSGSILNDYSLHYVTEPHTVCVGNLQVGMEWRTSEVTVPIEWDLVRFKEEMNSRKSKASKAGRGQSEIGGIVGLSSFEGSEVKSRVPAPTNDSEVMPWDDESADEVAFTPLPNPKLCDAVKKNPKILAKATLARTTRPNPEYEWQTHLEMQPKRYAAKYQMTREQLLRTYRESMYGLDPEPGLRSNPEYRFDTGPPGVAESPKVIEAAHRFNQTKPVELKPTAMFVGPQKPTFLSKQLFVEAVTHKSKQPLVEAVTRDEDQSRKKDALRQKARRLIEANCPGLKPGWRSHRLAGESHFRGFPPVTVNIWGRIFARQREEMREYREYQEWLRKRETFNRTTDEIRYQEYLYSWSPEQLQDALMVMEANTPSFAIRPVHFQCKTCEDTARARKAKAVADEAIAAREKRRRAKNPYGLTTIALKLKAEDAERIKAIKESAGSAPAKIRVPVIRDTSPAKSSPDSSGVGHINNRDTYGYSMQGYTDEERTVFLDTYEGRQVGVPWWRKVNKLKPSELIDNAINGWVNRGQLLVPPSYG